MKPQFPLMLIGMLLFEAFQTPAALKCYKCEGSTCGPTAEICSADQDRCQTITGQNGTVKGCSTKAECEKLGSAANC
ncbi:hypothetical protein MHYP_G00085500 [Metynnis hypsauchen]